MKFPCHYHPPETASWHCETCARFYCKGCVPCGHEIWLRAGGAKCAICFKRLDYLGSAVDAAPPTQEIINCLKLPLQTNILFVLIPVAFLLTLASLAASTIMAGYAIVPFLVISTIGIEYASSLFLARSEGRSEAPSPGHITKQPDIMFFLRHAVLILIGVSLTMWAQHWLAPLVYLLVLPASIMVLANERSLSSAISPSLVYGMIRAMGANYWIACGFSIAVLAGTYLSIQSMPVIWPFFFIYSLYSLYAFLGYLVYYHQYELSLRVPKYEEEYISKVEFEKRRALSDSFILFKENQLDRARDILKEGFHRCGEDLVLHAQYHKVLVAAQDDVALRNHSNFFVERSLIDNKSNLIPSVLEDTFLRLPDYRLESAQHCLHCAQHCLESKQYRTAIKLVKDFHQYYPDSLLVVDAYLMAATIFHTYLGDENKAAFLLDYLLKNPLKTHPKHHLKQQVSVLRGQLRC